MSYPPSLLDSAIIDAKPIIICTKNRYNAILNFGIPLVNLDENDDWTQTTQHNQPLCVEDDEEKCTLDDMAYTVYSSGTTGKPKGSNVWIVAS